MPDVDSRAGHEGLSLELIGNFIDIFLRWLTTIWTLYRYNQQNFQAWNSPKGQSYKELGKHFTLRAQLTLVGQTEMKTPVLLRKSFIIEDEATFDDFFDVQETEKTSRSARSEFDQLCSWIFRTIQLSGPMSNSGVIVFLNLRRRSLIQRKWFVYSVDLNCVRKRSGE